MVRIIGTFVSAALVVTCGVGMTAAQAQGHPHAGHGHKPKITLTLPASVVEGEPFSVQATVSHATGAKQVQLLHATGAAWEVVAKAKYQNKRKAYTFTDTGRVEDLARYRIKVLLAKGAADSDPAQTTTWHWTPMTNFASYESSPGTYYGNNVHINMNGVAYLGGWSTSGDSGSWVTRVTAGRHCNALRGVVGLSDLSLDGSSAVISVLADDTTTVYTSPTLKPGMAVPFQVALANPFRLAVQAKRTSLPALAPYPAIASPELLCTGLVA